MTERHRFKNGCKPDENGNITKSRPAGEISDPNKKSMRKKKTPSEKISGDSLKSRDESLLEADRLIQEIDATAESDTDKGTRRPSLVHCTDKSNSFNDNFPKERYTDPCSSSNVNRSTCSQSRVKAFDDRRVDLDAVEKWASASGIDIDFEIEKEIDHPVSMQDNKSKPVPDLLEKADVAVREIDTIIKGITFRDSKEPPQRHHKPNKTSSQSKTPVPVSMPTNSRTRSPISFHQPTDKTSTITHEGVVRKKYSKKPSPDSSKDSLKCVQSNPRSLSEFKLSQVLLEKSEDSECPQKVSSAGPASKYMYDPQFLPPSQVSEDKFEDVENEQVETRTIVLDYSASEIERENKKGNNCGLIRFLSRLCCCKAQKDAVEVLKSRDMESHVDNLKKIRKNIPSRIWKRVKKCFGF